MSELSKYFNLYGYGEDAERFEDILFLIHLHGRLPYLIVYNRKKKPIKNLPINPTEEKFTYYISSAYYKVVIRSSTLAWTGSMFIMRKFPMRPEIGKTFKTWLKKGTWRWLRHLTKSMMRSSFL